MPATPDYLDRLWSDVVNIDADGKWIERGIAACRSLKGGPYAECGTALARLRKACKLEDLGRLSRFSRSEVCFGVLCSLEDPGLPKGGAAPVLKLLKELFVGEVRIPKRYASFWESLETSLDPADDGEWLDDLLGQDSADSPFGDVGPALKRLFKAGATQRELGRMVAWSGFEACVRSLELLIESGLEDEAGLEGLHEMYLSSEPTGMEGRAGSWPLPATAKGKKRGSPQASEPLWKVKAGQSIAFSPDGKTLAVAGASGPARLLDAATGEERLLCDGIKAHIYRLAFSPDGKRIAVAQQSDQLTICDTKSGKVLCKVRCSEDEISGLEYSSKTGELLHSSWSPEIDVFDTKTGKRKEPLRIGNNVNMINAMSFFPDGKKLATIWYPKSQTRESHKCTVWAWPERKQLLTFDIPEQLISDIAVSLDGKQIAIPFRTYHPKGNKDGVLLADAVTGKKINLIRIRDPYRVVFIPKHDLLIATDGDDYCLFFNSTTGAELFKFKAHGDVCQLDVSPDGKYLAIASSARGAAVWNLKSILKTIDKGSAAGL